jgi:NAD(P)-dependent dehydrogenase (short-subunit alcohol dehydrogenase family)
MALDGIAGKVALVTGGASGIGAGAARRLSDEGARVVVVDSDGEGAERVVDALAGEAFSVTADVSREEDVERYTDEARERFGRIDLYHLNAGVAGSRTPFPELSVTEFDEVVAVNARGVFLGLRAALRQFARQGTGGAVVTTASVAGFRGSADLVAYHTSKHAVIGLSRCAALEGAPLGVRVNAIAPGIVLTGLFGEPQLTPAGEPEPLARARETTPLGRAATTEEVAALVAFLLSDEARYMTGGVHPVDGGASAVNPFRPSPKAAS